MNDQLCPAACRADYKDFAFFLNQYLRSMHSDSSHLRNKSDGIQCMREHLAYCNKIVQFAFFNKNLKSFIKL